MKINIRGNKVDITPAIREHIEEKIGKVSKYLKKPDDVSANVVAKLRGKEQIVEVTISIGKLILRCEESHTDLYAAVDLASDKIERQIRKNKTKIKKQKSKENDFNFDFDDNNIEEENKVVVKRKKVGTKPMSEEEAILQMEMIGHEFFVFKNSELDCVSIIYKRKDGDYGIIDVD